MTDLVSALIVYPDGKFEHKSIIGDLETLQGIVGGPIEFIFVTEGVHAYCHEEGKYEGLPANPLATRMSGLAGVDVVVGTVVFLGDGPDGEEGDLPIQWRSIGK